MSLNKIISSVQLICDAIASVVNIDVTIVDEDRIRLAGTGRYQSSIGEVVNEHSAFSFALRESMGFIIENPGEHQACLDCNCKDKCNEHAEVCCPILLGGKTIGVIGLIAFEASQRQALIGNQDNLMSFLTRMADLIATKLKEFESHEALDLMAKELEVVFESIDTGLLACDRTGNVIRVNQKLKRIFHQETILHLKDLFYEKDLSHILKLQGNSKNHYVTFKNGGQGIVDVALIKMQRETKGVLLTIKTLEEVMNTVNDMVLDTPSTGFDQIIGDSTLLLSAKELALKVASSTSTVLILGESGTGKELFARAIHHSSDRKDGPFVAINCAAIPDYLLESELFGYDEGAFTGAKRGGKPGKFQLASGGTLFLDEIGDMPLHLQGKLLRALQEKAIDRLGGANAIPVDVRVIAATHRDLEEKVEEGAFRQDLYYRLNVIPITLPPLRDRKDDLVLTVQHLVSKWCTRLLKPVPRLSDAFRGAILIYDWPGNVRELENAIEYAINVCDGNQLEYWHLPKRIITKIEPKETFDTPIPNHTEQIHEPTQLLNPLSPDQLEQLDEPIVALEIMEKRLIQAALKKFGDSGDGLAQAAQALGISRATLYRKIKALEGLKE